jgi:hypothetical protein
MTRTVVKLGAEQGASRRTFDYVGQDVIRLVPVLSSMPMRQGRKFERPGPSSSRSR